MLKNILLAVVLAALPMALWAAGDVRGWDHGGYGRLVFEWSQPTDYTVTQDGLRLTLRFDAPLAAAPDRAVANLRPYIASLDRSPDNRTVTLMLREAFTLRHYRDKGTVVLDFRRGPGAASPVAAVPSPLSPPSSSPPPSPPPPVGRDAPVPPTVALRLHTAEDTLHATFAWGAPPPPYRVEQGGPQTLTVTFSAPAQLTPDARLPDGVRTVASEIVGGRLRITLENSRAIASLASSADAQGDAVVTIRLNALSSPATVADPQVPPPASVAQDKAPVASGAAHRDPSPVHHGDAVVLSPTLTATALAATLGFPWQVETAAVVFRRAGFVWIVFDRPAQLDLTALRDAAPAQIAAVVAEPHPAVTILRLKTLPGLNPKLWRRGTAWQVDLRPQQATAETDITIQTEPQALPTPRLRVMLPGLGTPVRVLDPAVGDAVWLVPAMGVNHGVARARQFAELSLPPTAQGIVVTSAVPDLAVVREGGGVVITAPAGLNLSPSVDEPETLDSLTPRQQGRLFDLRRWAQRETPFTEQRQKLQAAIIDAPQSRRTLRRMRLAEFLFATGHASEARGVLQVAAADDPTVTETPLYQGLLGATLILDRRFAAGLKVLEDERLDRFPEIQLWRSAALAQLGQGDDAAALLARAPGLPEDYPPHLAMALMPPLVETWMRDRDAGDRIQRLFDEIGTRDLSASQRSRLQYLVAHWQKAESKTVSARQLLQKLESSEDHWTRTRAAFALVEMGLEQGHLPVDEAIATLEKLRFAWRGDVFEFRILSTLGTLLVQEKRYRYGMQVLDKALRRFPDLPEAKGIDDLMRATFRRLYLDGDADAMPPLQALSLFDEFRRLTPEDTSGDTMIRKLADRLVAVDLLDRAVDLLEHQIRERLSGPERGRTGAHLAVLKLLDRKPEAAIKALDLSDGTEMAEAVRNERRLLRARALFMQDKGDAALELMAPDASRAADRLRAEIYWDSERYPLLIATLERLVTVAPDLATPTPQQAQGIVNLAMALSLNQDYQKLATLRSSYAGLMAKTPYQNMFDVITRTPEETDISNYAEISAQFAEIRNFESFLEDYRQRLKNGTLSTLN